MARLILECLEARALLTTVSWNVDADGFWDVPGNWRDDQGVSRLPATNDDVILDRSSGDYTVTHRTGVTTIRSLTSQEVLVLTSGSTLALASDSVLHGPFTFTGGWLEGAGNLTVRGPWTWTGGTMRGTGATTIAASSTLSIAGNIELRGGRVFNNQGTVRFAGASPTLGIGDANSTVHNLGSGIVQTSSAGRIESIDGTGAFHNAGTVHVQGGTLVLAVSGTATGTFQTDVGATLAVLSTRQFHSGTRLLGPGLVRFVGSQITVFTLASTLTAENVELAGGNLWVTGSLNISRQLTWSSGILDGSGATSILAGATLHVTGDLLFKRLAAAHTLSNAGTILFTGTMVRPEIHGAVQNQVGGTIRVQVQNAVQFFPITQGGTVQNAGRVEVLSGTLEFGPRAGTSGGTFHAAAGARMLLPAGHTFQSGVAFTGPGLKTLSGQVNLSGTFTVENVQLVGTLRGTHTLAGSFTWLSGSLSGPGTTTVAADSTFTLGGVEANLLVDNGRVIHNHGTVLLAGGNELNLSGDKTTFVNEPDGVFLVPTTANIAARGDGAFLNAGTLVVESGLLGIQARFLNTGTVVVEMDSFLTMAGPYTQTDGLTRLLGGTLSASAVELLGGVLDGTGSVFADVVNAGRIEVGGAAAAGELLIFGNYTQDAKGVLGIEIGGLKPGSEHDHLAISGAARLDGTLILSLLNDFLPDLDAVFQIMTFGSLEGGFEVIDGLILGKDREFEPFADETGYYLRTQGR